MDQNHSETAEPITQIQKDSVITPQDLPPRSFRISLLIFSVVSLLVFAGLYFGTLQL